MGISGDSVASENGTQLSSQSAMTYAPLPEEFLPGDKVLAIVSDASNQSESLDYKLKGNRAVVGRDSRRSLFEDPNSKVGYSNRRDDPLHAPVQRRGSSQQGETQKYKDTPLSIPGRLDCISYLPGNPIVSEMMSQISNYDDDDSDMESRHGRFSVSRTSSLCSAVSGTMSRVPRLRRSSSYGDTRSERVLPRLDPSTTHHRDFQPRIPTRFSSNSFISGISDPSQEAKSAMSTLWATPANESANITEPDESEELGASSVVSALTHDLTEFDDQVNHVDSDDADSWTQCNTPGSESGSVSVSVSLMQLDLEQISSLASHEKVGENFERVGVSPALFRMADTFRRGVAVKDHVYHFKRYEKCFLGSEAIDFMIQIRMVDTREDAIFLGQRFVRELKLFHHVCWDHTMLKDDYIFYEFTAKDDKCIHIPTLSTIRLSLETPTESFQHPSINGSCTSLRSPSDCSICVPHTATDLNLVAEVFQRDVKVDTHIYHFKKYKRTFIGSEAVDRMLEANLAKTRMDAVFLGQRLFEELNLFHHVKFKHSFKDQHLFYTFIEDSRNSSHFSFSNKSSSAVSFDSHYQGTSSSCRSVSCSDRSPSSSSDSYNLQSSPLNGWARESRARESPGAKFASSLASTKMASAPATSSDTPSPVLDQNVDHRECAPQAPTRRPTIIADSFIDLPTDEDPRLAAPRVPVRHTSVGSAAIATTASYLRATDVIAPSVFEKTNRVTFGDTRVRVFERSLDFNPATSSGPSVGLGWSFEDGPSEKIKDSGQRNSSKTFLLSKQVRKAILQDYGYSKKEITHASRMNLRGREERKETINKLTARSMAASQR